MNPHLIFSLAGIVTEIVVVALLFYRHVWRTLPVFLVYCIWALCSDAAAVVVSHYSSGESGYGYYFVITFIDLALQLCVIVELAWSVLRPVRRRLSRSAVLVVAALIFAVGAVIWPFAQTSGIALPSRTWHLVVQLQQTVSILRVVFFLLMAGCSQVLALGWRSRELQVATGFGFYSLVSLVVAGVNAHISTGSQFMHLYWVVAFSFLVTLLYWVFSFARKEEKRQEFTPQAKELLLALAKSAHVTRAQLAELKAPKQRDRDAR